MAKPRPATITSNDKDSDETRVADAGDQESGDQATEQAAARGPVRGAKGKAGRPPGGANKKPGPANKGNRAARATRERGANKKVEEDEDKDEDEEGADTDSADAFWQYIVTASYRSRKARLDWGGGEDGE